MALDRRDAGAYLEGVITPLFIFECTCLACCAAVVVIGGLHLRAYMNSNRVVETDADVARFRAVVRFQMWASVLYIVGVVPALIAGTINAWGQPMMTIIIGLIPLWLVFAASVPFRKYEKLARNQKALTPELQQQLDELSKHWKEGFFPRL